MAVAFIDYLGLLDTATILTLALAGIMALNYIRTRKTSPVPPGPRGLPLVGNVFDAPTERHWLKFAELGDIWGEIFSFTVLGQTMIIVNSVKVAEDLLDVPGAIFSDRPVTPIDGELCGFSNALILSQYGDRVRTERKLFHRLFGTHLATTRFAPLISTEIHKLLRNIALKPAGLIDEIRRTTAGITLRIAYGCHLREGLEQDPLLKMFATAGSNFSRSPAPGAFPVDTVFRYWPEWLPGGGFHSTAKMWSKQLRDTVDAGLQFVKNTMVFGPAEPSFVSTLLEEKSHDDYLIKWAAISIEEGGSDTMNFNCFCLIPTAAQLEGFFLAMSLYPKVQQAAQEELDRVIGRDRFPDLSDRAQLPYLNALCKEVFRWHVASPIGVPHRAREDYIYNRAGSEPVLIPKGSLVIANIWKMSHDPERYADPMEFKPSRFIAKDGKEAEQDPARKLLADTIVFLACSAVLSVFNISKPRGNGDCVEPQLGQASGTVRCCNLKLTRYRLNVS
ncbi:cytochrome P450 [Mycena olivaceomarginata]|nr:cytochrome P450 [Mycena olivaceomarginata]